MSDYGLQPVASGDADHQVVVLHGIRQTGDHLRPFACRLAAAAAGAATVTVFGYDHTRSLVTNGRELADALCGLRADRIDIVGYSMGGLVARLAASDPDVPNPAIHTLVTLATPNRGSLSNAELDMLGQIGLKAFEFLSPLAPRAAGVRDLTRAADIMRDRYRLLLDRYPGELAPLGIRYASVPALFYHPHRAETEMGPSMTMSVVTAAFIAMSWKRRMIAMSRAHDGIVTEASNNLASRTGHDFSEVHLSAGREGPSRIHAIIDGCVDRDHVSVLDDADVPALIWQLLANEDWSRFECDPELRRRLNLQVSG